MFGGYLCQIYVNDLKCVPRWKLQPQTECRRLTKISKKIKWSKLWIDIIATSTFSLHQIDFFYHKWSKHDLSFQSPAKTSWYPGNFGNARGKYIYDETKWRFIYIHVLNYHTMYTFLPKHKRFIVIVIIIKLAFEKHKRQQTIIIRSRKILEKLHGSCTKIYLTRF